MNRISKLLVFALLAVGLPAARAQEPSTNQAPHRWTQGQSNAGQQHRHGHHRHRRKHGRRGQQGGTQRWNSQRPQPN